MATIYFQLLKYFIIIPLANVEQHIYFALVIRLTISFEKPLLDISIDYLHSVNLKQIILYLYHFSFITFHVFLIYNLA